MADTDLTTDVAPWGPRSGEPPAPAGIVDATPAPAPASWRGYAWAAASTLILAVWIALWAGPLGAVALVGGVFVHEFGHVLVINWAGAGPSSIRIIPFFGGAATMWRAPESDFKSVLISLAGPAFGLLAAVPFVVVAEVTGQRAWDVGAFYVGSLNLINLIPAAPLDGSKALGPVLWRIHPWLERAAVIVVAAFVLDWALQTQNWLFGAVVAMGAVRAFLMMGGRTASRPLSLGEWAASLGLYLVVVAACAAVTWWAVEAGGLASHLLLFGGQR